MTEQPDAPVRRPRFGPFLATGGLLGVVATVVILLTLAGDQDGKRRLAFYLLILLAGLGTLAGGVVAVWLDRHDAGRPVD